MPMVIDPADLSLFKTILGWLLNLLPKLRIRITFGAAELKVSPFAGGGWPHWSFGRDDIGLLALLGVMIYVRNATAKSLILTTGRVGVLFPRWWKPYTRSELLPPGLASTNSPFRGLSSSRIEPGDTKVVDLFATMRPAPVKRRTLLVKVTVNCDLGLSASRWIWLRGIGEPPSVRKREKPPAEELKQREEQKKSALSELEKACPGTAGTLDSLLRAEADVYGTVGRSAGGLGTVNLTYQGRSYAGVGPEWRTPGLPTQQFVVEEPENATLQSENWTGLKNLFASLPSDETRRRAADYLASHVDGEGKYAKVGYFIVGALWHLGYLELAVPNLRCLPGTVSEYSLGDALRLLAGFLRYKHELFKPEQLDQLEKTVAALNCEEGLFEIPERIRAIRALRLRRSG